jgi:outer membrane protein OmpA-like peptidoglycan-associated protein
MRTSTTFRIAVITVSALLFGTHCRDFKRTAAKAETLPNEIAQQQPPEPKVAPSQNEKSFKLDTYTIQIEPKHPEARKIRQPQNKNYVKLRPESNEYAFAYEPGQVAKNIPDTEYHYIETDCPSLQSFNELNKDQLDNITSIKMTNAVNSDYHDFGAILSGDGKTMYFSRYKHPDNIGGRKDVEDIWYSTWNEETQSWNKAQNIGRPINNKYPNYVNSVSEDGNTLLLGNVYLENGKERPGLSLSHKTEQGWSFPEPITIEGRKQQPTVMAAHLSNDGHILILSYKKRKDTNGEQDLYVSFKVHNNTYSEPMNLGSVINSDDTETSPFLSPDTKKLYFTTPGRKGYGQCDIYVSQRLDDTWKNWSEPQNIGKAINNDENQSFLSLTADGKAYYTSDADEGDLNIYEVVLPQYTPEPTLVKEVIAREDENESQFSNETNLSMAFFEADADALKVETKQELYRIANIMTESPNVELEIVGHSDNKGSEDHNYDLAQKRIEAIKDYLINTHHIASNRFIEKNYGETNPLADNETEDGRAMNRRCDMIIRAKTLVKD